MKSGNGSITAIANIQLSIFRLNARMAFALSWHLEHALIHLLHDLHLLEFIHCRISAEKRPIYTHFRTG